MTGQYIKKKIYIYIYIYICKSIINNTSNQQYTYIYIYICKSIINNTSNQQYTYWHLFLVTSWHLLVSSPLESCQFPVTTSGKKMGRKLVRAICAESIDRCMLLFLDHILYRRAHFVCNALHVSQAVLAIKGIQILIFIHHLYIYEPQNVWKHWKKNSVLQWWIPFSKYRLFLMLLFSSELLTHDYNVIACSHNSFHSHNSVHPLIWIMWKGIFLKFISHWN